MIHFHPLHVQKIEKETEDCVLISFDVPAALKDVFQFKQGQNITIRKELNGQELRRNYSICTSPLDHQLTIAVKKVPVGVFSTYANEELNEGDVLDVMPPTGTFYTELSSTQQKNYVAFAAGSGITPIISIIKTTLLTEPKSSFTLVYGNRTKASILFKEELEALKDKFIERFRIYHVLSREITDAAIHSGRLDKDKCELYCTKLIDVKKVDEFFICGPEAMIFCIKDFLEGKGVKKEHIHFELFTVPGENKLAVGNKELAINQGDKAEVTVRLDGISFSFELGYNDESILEAALNLGADLPYACKGGVCTTCKAKLTEGTVEMDRNFGLADDEVNKGYILTCQSHPRSNKLFVDFDAR
jgi:ring-1,2-phenylacetyl-CoA epoxidase subunit PaaE